MRSGTCSTTQLQPVEQPMPDEVRRIVERIGENCEPSLCTVLFLGGAGGSLRAGVTENPVLLTRAIKQALVNVTCGGAPAYVWPGGGITVMVDVHAHARQQLRHRADAGHRRADRIQHAAATTTRRSAATWSMCSRSSRRWRAAPGRTTVRRWRASGWRMDAANPWPLGQPPMLG